MNGNQNVQVNAVADFSLTASNANDCSNACLQLTNCLVSSFNKLTGVCSGYRSASNPTTANIQYVVFTRTCSLCA